MLCRTLLGAALICVCAGSGQAIELNHYAAGIPNLDDFFLPPPEAGQFIYGQYNMYYFSDTFRNSDGKKVDSITLTGPGGRPITIKLDIDIDNYNIAPLLMWAPKFTLLGARYGAYAIVPVGNPSLAADLSTEIGLGRSVNEGTWDTGDFFFQPLWLMWSLPHADITAGYGLYAPTGRYSNGALDNVGLGFWEHQLQTALRYHVDQARTLSGVLAVTIEIPQEKEDVDITPGSSFALNWGLRKNFMDDWLQLGVVGYDTWQITDDTGSAAPPEPLRHHDEVHAAGIQIGVPKLGVAFKYMHEYEARDRFEGQLLTLFFAVPLDPAINWISTSL
jgi:hypothetical protein